MRALNPAPASRRGQRARVALAGPSGAGKTYTALLLARALVGPEGRIVVIDTERGSAGLYCDLTAYDTVDWLPPFDPREVGDAVPELARDYDAVIPDSLSAFWNGEGGTQDIVDGNSPRGNTYAGWKVGTPAQRRLVDGLLAAEAHVVATMRSKQDYVLENRGGKQVPVKVGMAPVQRDGIEYEFDVVADLDLSHRLTVTKSRCDQLAGEYAPDQVAVMGETLAAWLAEGKGKARDLASRFDALAARSRDHADHEAIRDWVKGWGGIAAATPDLLDEWDARLAAGDGTP